MTCAFCKYEFCWACGESATTEERHFELGRGCGVAMMDETAKPNSHSIIEPITKTISKYAWRIGKEIL